MVQTASWQIREQCPPEQPFWTLGCFCVFVIMWPWNCLCALGAKSLQSYPTLCNPMDSSLPGTMGFSRQEYCSGLPCPPPGDHPDPGIKPTSLMSPALAGGPLTTSTTWEVLASPLCHIPNHTGHIASKNARLFFFSPCCVTCMILISGPGVKPVAPALGAQST